MCIGLLAVCACINSHQRSLCMQKKSAGRESSTLVDIFRLVKSIIRGSRAMHRQLRQNQSLRQRSDPWRA